MFGLCIRELSQRLQPHLFLISHCLVFSLCPVLSTLRFYHYAVCFFLHGILQQRIFFTKLSVTFLPWHSIYFVGYCKWIVFVQRKTFHIQPINHIFMKYSITELPYQLAEQIRWHKAWCLTCIAKLIFPCTGNKD